MVKSEVFFSALLRFMIFNFVCVSEPKPTESIV